MNSTINLDLTIYVKDFVQNFSAERIKEIFLDLLQAYNLANYSNKTNTFYLFILYYCLGIDLPIVFMTLLQEICNEVQPSWLSIKSEGSMFSTF